MSLQTSVPVAAPKPPRGAPGGMISPGLRTVFALALLSGTAAVAPGPAARAQQPPQAYTFTNVATSTEPLFRFFRPPAINDSGVVAFRASLETGGLGIYTRDGNLPGGNVLTTTTIADSNGPFSAISPNPSLNAAGTVAFAASLDAGGTGVFTGNGGGLPGMPATTTVADSRGAFDFLLGAPSINRVGTVAFRAALDDGGDGIFTGNGGPTAVVADSRGQLRFSGNPSINGAGTVVFGTFQDGGGPRSVFTRTGGGGGALTLITDSSGSFDSFADAPTITEAGAVAVVAFFDDGRSGIVTARAGEGATVAADTAGAYDFFGPAAMNDAGEMVFFARLDDMSRGLFTGADPLVDRLIGSGDPLFGGIVQSADVFIHGINANGQIAFFYELADGTEGIAVATPVPEPAAWAWLLLLGGGALVAGGSRAVRTRTKAGWQW